MGLFEELDVPRRFNRLRKYFNGLETEDLPLDLPYENYVDIEDKIMMIVFCRQYLGTKNDRDSDEEPLERTVSILQTMVKQKGDELLIMSEQLAEAQNQIHDLKFDKSVEANKTSVLQNEIANMLCPLCSQLEEDNK